MFTYTRKKIIFITGFFPLYQGGAEYQAFVLANKLIEHYDIYFIVRDHSDEINYIRKKFNEYRILLIKPVKILGYKKTYIFESVNLYNIISEISPHYIYARGANGYLAVAARYSQTHDCSLIWHIAHENDVTPFKFNKIQTVFFDYVDFLAIRYGIQRAHCIIAQTNKQKELLQQNHGLHCGTVIGNWHPTPDDCVKPKEPITIVWIANWKPIKQPQLFVQCVEGLPQNDSFRFIMLGRTTGYDALVLRARSAHIEVMGEIPIEAVNELLATSHLLVNTSVQEGFSNTFIQAWLHRVPVVSLQVDPDDILKKYAIGCHSKNMDQLALDVLRLATDHALREDMGERARAFALRNHSLDNLKEMESILLRLGD